MNPWFSKQITVIICIETHLDDDMLTGSGIDQVWFHY